MPSLVVKTPPTQELLSLSEAKSHLRVDISDDDALIESMISAIRRTLENNFRIVILSQELVMGLDYFGMPERMPTWLYGWPPSTLTWGPTGWMVPEAQIIELRGPVTSIVSITYTDPSGATQTVPSANYVADLDSMPARVAPALAKVWPSTAPLPEAVKIDFIAGYSSPAAVPDDIKAAHKLWLAHLYEHREQVMVDKRIVALDMPWGVQMLMAPYRHYLVR